MATLCTCDYTLSNSGTPNCPSIAKGARMLIAMNIYKDDGTKNKIPLATLEDQSLMQALIDEAVAENRIYPLPKMVNVENTRGDAVTEEFSDGSSAFIRKGVKSFVAEMKQLGYAYTGKLEENRYTEHGYIIIDEDGNFIFLYDSSDATNAFPIPIDLGSYDVNLMEHVQGTSIQKTRLNFNWSVDVTDGQLRTLKKPTAYNPLTALKGLLDVNGEVSSITTTTFTLTLTDDFGCAVSGLVIGDFSLEETSPTPASITITSVTESSDGVYDFVFPTETSADVLKVTPSKSGFDFTDVEALTITIP